MRVVAHEARIDEMRGDDLGFARFRAGSDEDRFGRSLGGSRKKTGASMSPPQAQRERRRNSDRVERDLRFHFDALWPRRRQEFRSLRRYETAGDAGRAEDTVLNEDRGGGLDGGPVRTVLGSGG